MHTSEFFELKDTASECSMDSAYQSQSGASRRGAQKSEVHQDSRSRMSNQFVGSDIYSPTMSSENYSTFPDNLDMSHMQPATSGTWNATEGPLTYANYSTAQDYTLYSAANMPRFAPSTIADSPQWTTSETNFQNNPFTFTSWPTNDTMFNSPQRNWQSASYDASERPATLRNSSSYSLQEESRRASAQDVGFGAFVGTPTSTTSVHFPQTVNNILEDTKPASVAHSVDDNEDSLSQSEAAETKLEEERTKVARSHPLYQQTPDKDGKYHCPEEGKTGCTHKPTSLKCNYE
jgi:hypothetical protein